MAVIFRQGDIMTLPQDAAAGCDFCFTDPPWGAGPLRMFETMMRKAGHAPPGNEIEAIIHRLFELVPPLTPLFVAYSVRDAAWAAGMGRAAGHELVRVIRGQQTNGRPFECLQFNSEMPPPEKTHAWSILDSALSFHRPRRAFEPFAGLGIIADRIAAFGVDVVAYELNPARATRGAARVAKR